MHKKTPAEMQKMASSKGEKRNPGAKQHGECQCQKPKGNPKPTMPPKGRR